MWNVELGKGNNVLLYFIEWIKVRHPNDWQHWIDQHILAYFAVAPPLLGAIESLRGAVRLSSLSISLPSSIHHQFITRQSLLL